MKDFISVKVFKEYLPIILVFWLFLYIFLKLYLRERKKKKLKYEWIWIVRKTKVSAVKERYVRWDRDSSWYHEYRLEAKDESGKVYESEKFKDVNHGWRTLEDMVKEYDGVVYELWNKDEAIKQINDNIQRIEMELQNNPWFFRKMKLKISMKVMNKYIDIANEWPITPYLICRGHKISVWDNIDVFVDPEDPALYYFDLDFTKQN